MFRDHLYLVIRESQGSAQRNTLISRRHSMIFSQESKHPSYIEIHMTLYKISSSSSYLRPTPKNLNSRWKDGWLGEQQQDPSSVQSATRRIMESRNVIFIETPSRLYSRHRLKKIPSRLIRHATARTTTTTSRTTTFCAIFAITLPCGNRFPVLLLTTSPWAGFQTIHLWLNS